MSEQVVKSTTFICMYSFNIPRTVILPRKEEYLIAHLIPYHPIPSHRLPTTLPATYLLTFVLVLKGYGFLAQKKKKKKKKTTAG